MANKSNVINSENYSKIKQEVVSDDNDQLIPTESVMWLSEGAEQQTYKEELYAGYVVQEDLVIGPEVLQQHGSTTDPVVTSEDIDIDDKQKILSKAAVPPVFSRTTKPLMHIDDTDSEDSQEFNFSFDPSTAAKNYTRSGVSSLRISQSDVQDKRNEEKEEVNKEITNHNQCSCTYCKNRHSVRSELKASGEKRYYCPCCKSSFRSCSNLKIHLRMHTGEKPYTCSYCNNSFVASSTLKIHLRTHTGEKPYTCPYCNYSCSNSSRLKIHLRRHTGEKPYSCSHCNYSCVSSSSLKEHLRTHTGEKPYSCAFCKYRCSRKNRLKVHLRTHTGEMPYK